MNERFDLVLREGGEIKQSDDHTLIPMQENIPIARPKDVYFTIEEKDYWACSGCFLLILAILLFPLMIPPVLICHGLFILNINEIAVITYNGKYVGSIKTPGYYWVNPVCARTEIISLKQRNYAGPILKVNDKQGNPLEISMNMIWRIEKPLDLFKVQNYNNYVKLQSDGALKELASSYAYDSNNQNEITLLRNLNEINIALKNELSDRLRMAGIICDEASLTHIHYPPEIAKVLLKKQEAEAMINAKDIVTKGIVGITQDCIKELDSSLKLTHEVKNQMINNLIMILTDTTDDRRKNITIEKCQTNI